MKLRLNRGTSANIFHRAAPVQSWHYPIMTVVARETFLSIMSKIDLYDCTLLTKGGIFESSQSFCEKQTVLAFDTLSEVQEDAILARATNPEKIE